VTNSSSKLRRTLVAAPKPPTMMRLNEAEPYLGLRHSLTTGVVAEQPAKPSINAQTAVIGKNERFTSHFRRAGVSCSFVFWQRDSLAAPPPLPATSKIIAPRANISRRKIDQRWRPS